MNTDYTVRGVIQPGLLLFVLSLIATLSLAAPDVTDVRWAQAKLSEAGINPGPVDGVMGNRTHAAIRIYQEKQGLPVTGELDEPTMQALRQADMEAVESANSISAEDDTVREKKMQSDQNPVNMTPVRCQY